jgi:hypothetical protein
MGIKMKGLARTILGIILLIVGINALGGGYYGMSGAKDIPLNWLKGSPFHSYLIPSVFLFFIIGGSCLWSASAVFRNMQAAMKASLFTGLSLILWIIAQVLIIGYVSWLQPAMAIAGLSVVLLSLQLKPSAK